MLTKSYERIKVFRTLKGWTQEKMAEKLGMSVIGYGNIERGDTDATLSKLEEIAKVLGIELHDLFNSQGKIIINLGENSINVGDNNQNTQAQKELEHELEKSRLIVEQQRKELSLVYQEVEHLKEIILLLKQQNSS